MGTFHVTIEVAANADGPYEAIEALADSAETYTLLPRPLLERLGVRSVDTQVFVLADGREIERPAGEVLIRVDGRTQTNVVVFGEGETESLLGAVTLESLGLGIDPVGRELIRVRGYLMAVRGGGPR